MLWNWIVPPRGSLRIENESGPNIEPCGTPQEFKINCWVINNLEEQFLCCVASADVLRSAAPESAAQLVFLKLV